MQILEFPSAAAVVNIKDKIVDFYLVLTGKVMIESPGKKTVIRNNFELFGSTAPLRDEEYERFSVTTLEHSFIIRVPREKFLKIIDQFHLFLEKKRTVNFMGKSIPGGQLISESGKLNLLSLFTNAEFVSGEVLLKDGEVSEYAYIIREGECRLVCSNTSINQK